MATNDLLQDVRKEKDYFLLTVKNLKPGLDYPIQLRWQKEDGSRGLWSAAKVLSVPGYSDLPIPYFSNSDVTSLPGMIRVFWNGKDTNNNNIDMSKVNHIAIFIEDSDNIFDSAEAGSLKSKGGTLIPLKTGTYNVYLASVDANGRVGTRSGAVQVDVQGGFPIDKPTLPIGLSVKTAAFGITASWTGKYQGDQTFGGFKAINIYASTSDLGSSTTNTSLATKLVGSMTVDTTANKITIGMEVLKQTLSLTSSELYNSSLFFYQVAVNANGLPYQINGVTTYTRINTTGIAPTKANIIDLENGTISIENLVAGNGQFQSWLRTGEPGGARIELSSSNVNSSEAGGYTVLSGFTVYDSANDPVFRADLAGNVAFGGYTPSDISSISTKANSADSNATQAQQDAYAANQAAIQAAAAAATAYAKTSHFNSDGSEIILGIKIPTGQGSIYSNKSTYGSSYAGWFLGNVITSVNGQDVVTPVIDIGDISNGNPGVRWTGSQLQVKGQITADSGTLGSTSNGWKIENNSITSYSENSSLTFGDSGSIYTIKRTDGQFTVKETVSGTDNYILNTYGASGTEGARLYIGSSTRQVEVTKPAQISGYGTDLTQAAAIQSSDNRIVQAYRSGGLRNMYTVVDTRWDALVLTANGAYPSAANGDVLLVYTV